MAETVRLMLRLPGEVHEAVRGFAEADLRSLNAEIVYILQRYIEDREKESAGGRDEGKVAA